MDKKIIRSPFFYVGDKYKLMKQLKGLMPDEINMYIEPFVGGGSSFLNTTAKVFVLNDIDEYVIKLHKELVKYSSNPNVFFEQIYNVIDEFGLSCSFLGKIVPLEIKKKYTKTYYAKYNKEAYNKLRAAFNKDKNNMVYLYVLLIYGFNHMIRFNSKGDFNLPVGNVDFNKNVYVALNSYFEFVNKNEISFYNCDYQEFLNNLSIIGEKDYVFFDPPYLISMSEYNKLWNLEKEKELCNFLDKLNEKNIRFGITNLISHKGKNNEVFSNWAKKYYVYEVNSNYISFNDNTVKKDSVEIFVTNYVKKD